MNEKIDEILEDESINLNEALSQLTNYFIHEDSSKVEEIKKDLMHAFDCKP